MDTNNYILTDEFLSKLGQLKIIQKRKSTSGELGLIKSKQIGGQIDFHEHRLYQKGDEPRHIDWNVYNRLKQLTVKVFNKQETSENFIILDASASMGFFKNSKSLKACQVVAAIAYLSLTSENSIQLFWCNQNVKKTPKMQNNKSVFTLLKTLSEIKFNGIAKIEEALHEITRQNKKGNINIISDFYSSEEILKTISKISPARFKINLFQILSLQELDFETNGLYTMEDSETSEQKKVKVTAATRKLYVEHITKFTENLKKTAFRYHCEFFNLLADTSFEDTVLTLRHHQFFK